MFIERPSFDDSLELRRSGMYSQRRAQTQHVAPTELCFFVTLITTNLPLLRSCQPRVCGHLMV